MTFHRNAQGAYHCPVTFKTFTDNTKIAAISTSGNVFAYSAIEELNLRSKNWTDLLSGETFHRRDIIILQDPQDASNREIDTFEHLRIAKKSKNSEGSNASNKNIRTTAASSRILKAVEEKKESQRIKEEQDTKKGTEKSEKEKALLKMSSKVEYSKFTDGSCSRSLTSTTYQPTTENAAALASEDEVLKLRWEAVKKMKKKGYVTIHTRCGTINLELHCDVAPMTCDNFLSLCANGYYNGVSFHRIIKGFMVNFILL